MFTVEGKYGEAKIFADIVDEKAIGQVIELLNQEFVEGSKVRIMPDVHPGAGCVIGFTADLGDKVIPNIVGVDIGCGMLTVPVNKDIDVRELDKVINKKIPFGFNNHKQVRYSEDIFSNLLCYDALKNKDRFPKAIGSLGGGNHFIEVGAGQSGTYLVIHSGSRNLGYQVAAFYQKLAISVMSGTSKQDRDELIREYKEDGNQHLIRDALASMEKPLSLPKALCYLDGENRDAYLHDMEICQHYASENRLEMAAIILENMGLPEIEELDWFETVHNYISFDDNIIRKGAISANEDEAVLIPINMRDGSILGRGKGNSDWNFSAPHGAGRTMSRTQAKQELNLEDFEDEMSDVYTTSVGLSTLDEAPSAYKPIESILDNIGDAVDVYDILIPIYNFKAS